MPLRGGLKGPGSLVPRHPQSPDTVGWPDRPGPNGRELGSGAACVLSLPPGFYCPGGSRTPRPFGGPWRGAGPEGHAGPEGWVTVLGQPAGQHSNGSGMWAERRVEPCCYGHGHGTGRASPWDRSHFALHTKDLPPGCYCPAYTSIAGRAGARPGASCRGRGISRGPLGAACWGLRGRTHGKAVPQAQGQEGLRDKDRPESAPQGLPWVLGARRNAEHRQRVLSKP